MTTTDDLRAALASPAPLPGAPDLGAIRAGARRRVRRRRAAVVGATGTLVAAVAVVAAVVIEDPARDPVRATSGPTTSSTSTDDVGTRLEARVRADLPGVATATSYAHDRREPDVIPARPARDPGHAAQWDVLGSSAADRTGGSQVVLEAAWGPGTGADDPATAACGAAAGYADNPDYACHTSYADGVRVDVVNGFDHASRGIVALRRVAVAYRQGGRFVVVVRETTPHGMTMADPPSWTTDQLTGLALDPAVAFPVPGPASPPVSSPPASSPPASSPPSATDVGGRLRARVGAHLPGVAESTAYAHDRREADDAIPAQPARDPGHAAQWDVIAYSGAGRTGSRVVLQAAWGPGTGSDDPATAACGAGAEFDHLRGFACTSSTIGGVRVDLVEGPDTLQTRPAIQRVAIAYRDGGRFLVIARERRSLTEVRATRLAWGAGELRSLVLDPAVAFPDPGR